MEGKLIIFSAPSGAGKTTIVKHLLTCGFNFGFSISATTRKPRGLEINGREYYFLYYGTLKSEVERICQNGQNIIFDVDVIGGFNIKKIYKDKALAVFVQPPSIEELQRRLTERSTDSPEVINCRIAKAEEEMSYLHFFDVIIVNDKLDIALKEAEETVRRFLGKQ